MLTRKLRILAKLGVSLFLIQKRVDGCICPMHFNCIATLAPIRRVEALWLHLLDALYVRCHGKDITVCAATLFVLFVMLFRVTTDLFFLRGLFPGVASMSKSAEIPRPDFKRRIMLRVRGRLPLKISETRARVPINGSRSLRVSPCCSMRNSMAAMGLGASIR